MKILIIKLGALGDVLRTSFIAKGLKKKHNAEIFWLTKEIAMSLLKNNPYIDKIITWKEKEQLLEEEFNWIISLDDEEEVCSFAKKLKTKKFQGAYVNNKGERSYTPDVEAWFGMGLLRHKEQGGKEKADELKKLNRKTFQDIYAGIFELSEMSTEEKRPKIYFDNKEKEFGEALAKEKWINKSNKIIGVNTGASKRWPLKMISVKKTAIICNELAKDNNNKILLLGGTDEEERNHEIKALCSKENIIVIEPRQSIREFAGIVNLCNLIITADTLALHIALALNKKTIVFFGPTSPWEIEMFGLGKRIYKETPCLCCYKNTSEQEPNCIDIIEPEDILVLAKEMIK